MSAISRSPCAEVIALSLPAGGLVGLVGEVGLVGVVALEQPAHAEGRLAGAGGVAEDDGEEAVGVEAPQSYVGARGDGRRPGAVPQQGDLAEPFAGAQGGQQPAVAHDVDLPGLHDVVAVTYVALLEDRGTRSHLPELEAADELLDR